MRMVRALSLIHIYPLRSVLELSQVDAVVFNGMAYPLDGGRPEPVEIDPALYPFQIPLMDRLSEGGGYSVPVRALCEGCLLYTSAS